MKKLTLFLLAAACLSAQAFGQAARFDGVAQSTRLVNGITLTIPLPSATITVYNFGTTTKASVCPDITATSCSATVPNNPVTSDAQGNFGFWIPGGVYDYTVTPSSGTVQGPYHAVVPFGATAGGTITYSKSFENVRYADQFAGVDFSAKVNACIADVISHGGGICDAIALDGTQTISSQINLGQRDGTSVVLRLAPALNATVTITDGTSCGIKVFDKSSLIGYGTGGSSKTFIKGTTGTNVDSLVCTDDAPTDGGSYVRIEGIEPWNISSSSGTYVNGMVNVQHLYDDSVIRNVFVRADGVVGWFIHDICCGTSFYNIGANGFGSANSQPCIFGKNGEHTGGNFIGISCVHPGDGKNAYLFKDAGASYTAINILDLYTECNTTDLLTPLIQINSGANGTILIDGISTSGPACAGATAAYLVDIDAAARGVMLKNVRRFANLPGTINDHANSITITASYVPSYSYGGNTYLGSLRSLKIGSGTEFTSQTGSGSAIVSDISPSIQTQASITGAAATNRQLNFSTAGVARWIARANNTAEGGANAGSDFELVARDDSGGFLATTLFCARSTSNCTFAGAVIGPSLRSSTSNVASAGAVRLAKTDAVNFRNNANGADVNGISLDGSDVVQVGGAAGFKAGASGSAIPDTRELLQNAHSCGTTSTCANTANGSNRIIFGSVALASATPSAVTVTGISPAFTSSSSYFCTATPQGATAAIAAGGITVTNVSSSSFTLTGPNTVTTVINYACVGN